MTVLIQATDDHGAVAAANAAYKAFSTIRYVERSTRMSLTSGNHAVSFIAYPTDLDGLHFTNINVRCLQTGEQYAVSYEYDDDTGYTVYRSRNADEYGVHDLNEVVNHG